MPLATLRGYGKSLMNSLHVISVASLLKNNGFTARGFLRKLALG